VTARDVSDADLIRHWHDIESATALLHRQLDADLEAAGVPPQWYPALELLLSAEGHRLPMSTLARELTMTSGGFSKLADRMAAEGLIDRRGTTDDRRVVHATLTDAGHELASTARAAFVKALRNRVNGTDAHGLALTATALRRLAAGVDADAAPSDGKIDGGDGGSPDPTHHTSDEKGADETPVPLRVVRANARERDPALPDRRRRGHVSGTEVQ